MSTILLETPLRAAIVARLASIESLVIMTSFSRFNRLESLHTACRILIGDEIRVLPMVDTYTITEVARLSGGGWLSEVDRPVQPDQKNRRRVFFVSVVSLAATNPSERNAKQQVRRIGLRFHQKLGKVHISLPSGTIPALRTEMLSRSVQQLIFVGMAERAQHQRGKRIRI